MQIYEVWAGEKRVLARCESGDSPLFRYKGLLGRSFLMADEGILLPHCNSIHMFFMKFPIDAIFLDKGKKIVRICHGIKPWRISPLVWSADAVLETAAGVCRRCSLSEGDILEFNKNADNQNA